MILGSTTSTAGELIHSYSVESGGELEMTKQEIIEMSEPRAILGV